MAAIVTVGSDSSDAVDINCNTYYYDQMSPLEKTIYDGAKTADMVDKKLVFTIDLDTSIEEGLLDATYKAAVERVSKTFYLESVSYVWIGMQWSYTIEGDKVTITVEDYWGPWYYEMTNFLSMQKETYDAIDKIEVDTSCRYTIVKSIHDYISGEVRYSESTLYMEYANAYKPLTFPNYGNDAGYATAFKLACDRLGVPCIIVTGNADNGKNTATHYWNYVQMEDEQWYLVNTMWDKNGWNTPFSTYLLIGSGTAGEEYLISSMWSIPDLSTEDYAKNKYLVKFVNYDGSYLPESGMYTKDSALNASLTASYTNSKIGTFTFKGWDQTIPSKVTGDATFTAEYNISYVEYTYIFTDLEGKELSRATYHFGDAVVTPEAPVKEPTSTYVYPFSEWSGYDAKAGYDISEYPSGKTCQTVYKEIGIGYEFDYKAIHYVVNADGTVSVKNFIKDNSYGGVHIPIYALDETNKDKPLKFEVTGFIAGAGLTYTSTYYVLDDSTGGTNPHFVATEYGYLYNGDMTVLYSVPYGGSGNSYEAPETLVEVYPYAFAGVSSKEKGKMGWFTFNEGLKKIGDNAFQYCVLEHLIFPSTLEEVGNNLFLGAGAKSYYSSSSAEMIFYMEDAHSLFNANVLGDYAVEELIIYTYDSKLAIDGVTTQFMARYVGEKFTYKGITYEVNSTDLGIGERFHAVTAVSYNEDMKYIDFSNTTLGWRYIDKPEFTGYRGETYVVTKVDPDFFKTAPSFTETSVYIGRALEELSEGFFSFLDKASIYVDPTYFGDIEYQSYSVLYTKGYTQGALMCNGKIVFVSSDVETIDSNLLGLVESIGDYAFRGTDKLQSILFSVDFNYLGKGNFDNITFRNADNTKDIPKTAEALAGKYFTLQDGVMVEVPTVSFSCDKLYGYISDSVYYTAKNYQRVNAGSVVKIEDNVAKIYDGETLLCTVTANVNYPGMDKFIGWNVEDGYVINETLILEAKFSGRPYVQSGSVNPEWGTVTLIQSFVSSGTTFTVEGNTLTFGYSTITATPNDGCAFKAWYYTDSSHVMEPINGSITVTQSTIFYATFSGPCNVTISGGAYGVVDTEQIVVPQGTTFTTSENVITFSDGTKVTVTGKTLDRGTAVFQSWNPSSGTVEGNMIISANFEVDDRVSVTIRADDSGYGSIDGKESVTFLVPYETKYSYSEGVFTFGDVKVNATPIANTKDHRFFINTVSSESGTVTEELVIDVTFARSEMFYIVTITCNVDAFGTVDGKESVKINVPYQEKFTVEGNTLTIKGTEIKAVVKDAPTHHVYSFVGWNVESGNVTEDMNIIAEFKDELEKFTVTVSSNNKDYGLVNGKESETFEIAYGTAFTVEGHVVSFGKDVTITAESNDPTVESVFSFNSWSVGSGTVEGDMNIVANFNCEPRLYSIVFTVNDVKIGTVNNLRSYGNIYGYGSTITVDGNTVTIDGETVTANVVASGDKNVTNQFVKFVGIQNGTVTGELNVDVIFESKITDITVDKDKNATIETTGESAILDNTIIEKIKEKADSFTAATEYATLTFDKGAIDKMSAATLSATLVDGEDVPVEVKDAYLVIEIDFGDNHDFSGGKITVTIPAYLDSDKVVIGYVHDGKIDKIDAKYDSVKNVITFEVDHLSTFAVLDSSFFGGDDDGGNSIVFIAIAVVVVLAVAVGIFFFLVKSGKISIPKKN